MNLNNYFRNYLKFDQALSDMDCSLFVHPWDMNTKGIEKYFMPWLVGLEQIFDF